MKKYLTFGMVLALAGLALANVTIPVTGIDANGNGIDDNYSVYYNGPDKFAWVALPYNTYIGGSNSTVAIPDDARWVSTAVGSNGQPASDAEGIYTFEVNFEVADTIDLDSLVIEGLWASDNQSRVLLNGVDTGYATPETGTTFGTFYEFVLSEHFVAGTNTLSFVVTNRAGGSYNPNGLLVSSIETVTCNPLPGGQTPAVPAPGALLLGSLGTLLAGKLRRR